MSDPCGRQGGRIESLPWVIETWALEEKVTDGFRSVTETAIGRSLNLNLWWCVLKKECTERTFVSGKEKFRCGIHPRDSAVGKNALLVLPLPELVHSLNNSSWCRKIRPGCSGMQHLEVNKMVV